MNKLPTQQRRSETLRLRVTPTEADAIYRRAIRARLSVSNYLRSQLVAKGLTTEGGAA